MHTYVCKYQWETIPDSFLLRLILINELNIYYPYNTSTAFTQHLLTDNNGNLLSR